MYAWLLYYYHLKENSSGRTGVISKKIFVLVVFIAVTPVTREDFDLASLTDGAAYQYGVLKKDEI